MAAQGGASEGPMERATAVQREALRGLCAERLAGRRLWLASNRGPLEFREEGGQLLAQKGQGGLVTALGALAAVTPVHWVAAAMSRLDARVAREAGGRVRACGDPDAQALEVSFVDPTPAQYTAYYDGIANAVLWLVQHHVCHTPTEPTFDARTWEAWQDGYVAVNRQFADRLGALAAQAGEPPVFLVQDYHLYLVPGLLRARFPEALIQHFTHIAWPSPDGWRLLPGPVREAILVSLLACDVVGFQSPRHVVNFLTCCAELLGLPVDLVRGQVALANRVVQVRDYPISIDPARLRAFAGGPEVEAAGRALETSRPLRTLALVARTDPSKNVLRTLQGYEYFLERFPAWHGEVRMVALLPLSRQSCPVYRAHTEAIAALCERIEGRWRRPGWEPLMVCWEHDYARAVALLGRYDVLIVNSIADGMNLVAKEGPTLNTCAGSLILSEGAGACEELGHAARVIHPFDVVALAEAIDASLREGAAGREWALAAQRAAIQAQTIYRWAHDQLDDLLPVVAGSAKEGSNEAGCPRLRRRGGGDLGRGGAPRPAAG